MNTVNVKSLLLLTTLALNTSICQAVTLRDLLEFPAVSSVKISPGGDYIALRIFQDGKHSLRFLDRKSYQPVGGLAFSGSTEVGHYFWVNNERVVIKIYEISKGYSQPAYRGELYAVNFDGKRKESIFGYRNAEWQIGSRLKKKDGDIAWAELIDIRPDDERHIMISSTPMSASFGKNPLALILNVYTGMTKANIKSSRYGYGRFYTDDNSELRFIVSRREDHSLHIEAYPDSETGWIEFPEISHGNHFTPVAIADDKHSVFVLDNIGGDKIGLHQLALDGSTYENIYAHERVDITSIVTTVDGNGVYAMRVDDGYPSYLIFSKAYDEALVFKQLLDIFQGSLVYITSSTWDGKLWIIRTRTDTDDGSYYLFNRNDDSIQLLFRTRPNVNEEALSPTEPVEFTSFDETLIPAYFTPAVTSTKSIAPMVVLVHGGPRSRDYWEYDAEVQALATHGYSVLRINYRGSYGYGNRFQAAGNRQWGDAIQRDIIAGTRWAIEQNLASADNICIMGASFGAYSAVQSSILAPDLYRCAVANAGIYDLSLLYSHGDIESRYGGKAYLMAAVGDDKTELARYSPVNFVTSLKTPIFLAHGGRDDRAPIKHANKLKKQLDKFDKEYDWFSRSREGHGFYDIENRLEYLTEVLKFLDKHLKKAP